MESSIFVTASFKGVFWHFKVDQRILLTLTVIYKEYTYFLGLTLFIQVSIDQYEDEQILQEITQDYQDWKLPEQL